VTDASWAKQLGLANSGHAPQQPSTSGPSAGHLVVAEGDLCREELLQRLGNGLLVRQLHYVNVVEPRELVLTGMTRGGVFRVSDGAIGGAIGNLRFTQSLVEALGAIDGVGDRAVRVGSLMGGELVAPALLIRGFQFTSKARS
jgi:predicted Zn-dependent protease